MPGKGRNPEDEQSCSFSGLVVAKESQNPENEQSCSFSGLVVAREM
jgi:hypothetical protein